MTDQRVVAETLARAARRKRIQQALISLGLLVALIFNGVTLLEIQTTSDYLKECTTPSTDVNFHRCYEDGQRRTQEAVKAIVDSQTYNSALLVCLLSIPPAERTDADLTRCKRESTVEGAP